jgi:hypothetical protein
MVKISNPLQGFQSVLHVIRECRVASETLVRVSEFDNAGIMPLVVPVNLEGKAHARPPYIARILAVLLDIEGNIASILIIIERPDKNPTSILAI